MSRQSKVVLLVEDDANLRQTLCEIMRDEGYEVVATTDGQDALDWLASSELIPQAVVTDLMMPRVDGWELCGILHHQQAWKNIPVLVVSSALHTRAWPAGTEPLHQMRKPPDLDHLLSVLNGFATLPKGSLTPL